MTNSLTFAWDGEKVIGIQTIDGTIVNNGYESREQVLSNIAELENGRIATMPNTIGSARESLGFLIDSIEQIDEFTEMHSLNVTNTLLRIESLTEENQKLRDTISRVIDNFNAVLRGDK